MNNERIGLFIKQLREERKLSQERLGELVNVTRQAVSKWERALSAPDSLTLILLSEVLKVSVDELIAGERKGKNNNEAFQQAMLNMYDANFKKTKLIKRLIIGIVMIVIIFLSYYFINTYNKTKVYLIDGATANFTMKHGIFLATNNKFYFRLGTFNNETDKEISEFHLYYINEQNEEITLFKSDDPSILLVDRNGYNVYFDYEELPVIIENLYLDITYNEITETMDLNLEKDFANNYLTFFKKDVISEEENTRKSFIADFEEIEKKIIKNFTLRNGVYYYEMDGITYEYVNDTKLLRMKNDSSDDVWNYYLNTQMQTIMIYENEIFIDTCWNTKGQIKCENGSTILKQTQFEYFNNQLEKLFNHFN